MILYHYYYLFRLRIQQFLWNISRKFSVTNGVVLMYHHISDIYLENVLDSCQHTTKEFIDSINYFYKLGYKFVSIEDAYSRMCSRNSEKFVVITFDDVPLSAYKKAVPILKEMNLPFTFFITTKYLGSNGYLSTESLKELDKCPLSTIGSHTQTHPNLRKSNNSFQELTKSKNELETLLGHSIDYLAYPYGRHSSISNDVIRLAKKAGYKCAFSTVPSYLTDCSWNSLFFLPRIVLKNNRIF